MPAANMQYTKLGFSKLFKDCGSHQVPCSLIVNRSVIPNFAYLPALACIKKTTQMTDREKKENLYLTDTLKTYYPRPAGYAY